jgi:5-methylcytosine-specific restriction protein A
MKEDEILSIQALLPDPESRQVVLEFLVGSIRKANLETSGRWAVIVGKTIQLKVGRSDVLTISSDSVIVLINSGRMPKELKSLATIRPTREPFYRIRLGDYPEGKFDVQGSFECKFRTSDAVRALKIGRLRVAHDLWIKEAARTELANYPVTANTIEMLQEFCHTQIPYPSYLQPSSTEEVAAAHNFYPEELEESDSFSEGCLQRIFIDKYERSTAARVECIAHYGPRCSVCRMSFEEVYGDSFRNFIHVHHLRPISKIGTKYQVDPVRDLRPVCPNCHAAIHSRKDTPYSIEEVQDLLRKAQHVIPHEK